MAKLTVHNRNQKVKVEGAAKLLKEFMPLKEALSFIKDIEHGKSRTLDIPFIKMEEVKKFLTDRGFTVS